MGQASAFAASLGALLLAAGLVVAALRLQSILSFVLGVYILGVGEIVLFGLVLSPAE